jgi:lysophospholipase L1-like esterase
MMAEDTPRLKPWILWAAMIFIMALLFHVVVESTVQLFFAKRSGVWKHLEDFRDKADKDGLTLEQFSRKAGLDPYLGWGKNEARIHMPPPAKMPVRTVLFVGDSVTAGHDVQGGVEDYPALLADTLGGQGIKVANLAARGFGVDQMWLRLLTEAGSYRPDVIVLAYIPHDLLRPANDFNFGLPKSRFQFSGSSIDLTLAKTMTDYRAEYESARSRFMLSTWYVSNYLRNKEYYLPGLFTAYYRQLYQHIGDGLAKLSHERGVPILVVKLTNQYHFSAQDKLIALAKTGLVHSTGWDKANVRYVDTDDCVTSMGKAQGLDLNKEFSHHPGPAGHRLLAECLQPVIESALGQR